MKPSVGPVLPEPLVIPEDIKKLKTPVDVYKELNYVFEAITLTRHKLEGKVPLIGFSGAPWTLMTYMIEGGGSKTMSKAKHWLYKYPNESKQLLEILTNVIVDYLVGQAKAGAQLLQLFESNAEYLDLDLFKEFALPYINTINEKVTAQLKEKNLEVPPMTIFAKGAHYALEELSKTNYNIIGLDWTIEPSYARSIVRNKTLQGNLDPCALYSSKEQLRKLGTQMAKEFGKKQYIANLGHGIYPDMDPDHVQVLIDAIHDAF